MFGEKVITLKGVVEQTCFLEHWCLFDMFTLLMTLPKVQGHGDWCPSCLVSLLPQAAMLLMSVLCGDKSLLYNAHAHTVTLSLHTLNYDMVTKLHIPCTT